MKGKIEKVVMKARNLDRQKKMNKERKKRKWQGTVEI